MIILKLTFLTESVFLFSLPSLDTTPHLTPRGAAASAVSYSNGSPRQPGSVMAGGGGVGGAQQTPPARSNSAIDASAVRRASVRAQYAMRGRHGLTRK